MPAGGTLFFWKLGISTSEGQMDTGIQQSEKN